LSSEIISYRTVVEWDEKRTRELSRMFKPYVEVTDNYADLVCEIVDVIGHVKPDDLQDAVVRDLLGDVFDSLHEARRIILTGKCNIAYPLARRVYESLSLLVACVLNAKFAVKWHSGREIGNAEVRRELAKHPLGETEESTNQIYNFFCLSTHPNRDLVPRRFLGEGNEFVLGSVFVPSLYLVTEYCMIHLRQWFWFAAVLLHRYRSHIDIARPSFGPRYLQTAHAAQKVQAELERHLGRLLEAEKRELAKHADPYRNDRFSEHAQDM
jgi:hypothetical protein